MKQKYFKGDCMKKGKLIVIEGTDCSGKETQSKLLIDYLIKNNIKCEYFSFPNYDSPTGKIIGGPYLGKKHICDGWFKEGAINVPPKVASLYYAADRLYNIEKITNKLDAGINIILDRYVYSNMAHQAGKLSDKNERIETYEWIEKLEFEFLGLPKHDLAIYLHMPIPQIKELRENREEKPDELEKEEQNLINSERAYQEIALKYNFKTIECAENNKIKTIVEISEDVIKYVNVNI